MKILLLAALLAFAAPASQHERYLRTVHIADANAQQAVIEVPADIYRHAQPDLSDIRLFAGNQEVPFILVRDSAHQDTAVVAKMLNLGERRGQTSFDLHISSGEYDRITLSLAPETPDFVATAHVTGSATASGAATDLGAHTIYSFEKERLGAQPSIELPRSNFEYLHVRLDGPLKANAIKDATVEHEPEIRSLHTLVADFSGGGTRSGNTTSWTLQVPKAMPVSRVLIEADEGTYARDVNIYVGGREIASGTIDSLDTTRDNRRISSHHNALDFYPQHASEYIVTINNGDDPPLHIRKLQLFAPMVRLYFAPAGNAQLTLFYGDDKAQAPTYEYARLTTPDPNATPAILDTEIPNSAYQPRPDDRPFTERHPAVLWTAMIAAVLVLGAAALRGIVR